MSSPQHQPLAVLLYRRTALANVGITILVLKSVKRLHTHTHTQLPFVSAATVCRAQREHLMTVSVLVKQNTIFYTIHL